MKYQRNATPSSLLNTSVNNCMKACIHHGKKVGSRVSQSLANTLISVDVLRERHKIKVFTDQGNR